LTFLGSSTRAALQASQLQRLKLAEGMVFNAGEAVVPGNCTAEDDLPGRRCHPTRRVKCIAGSVRVSSRCTACGNVETEGRQHRRLATTAARVQQLVAYCQQTVVLVGQRSNLHAQAVALIPALRPAPCGGARHRRRPSPGCRGAPAAISSPSHCIAHNAPGDEMA
jgi:hypothetical protein